MVKTLIAIGTATIVASVSVFAETAPYAGQDQRSIATLSGADIDALLAGQGWGFALAAELNGYPGPLHVLELAKELELTDQQRAEVQSIYDDMNKRARALGADYVRAEAELSDAFNSGNLDEVDLETLVARSARIEAELRSVHLAAHLEIKPLMSRHQVVLYNNARGYDSVGTSHGHDGHSHD